MKSLNWVKNIVPTEGGVTFDLETVTNAYVKRDEVKIRYYALFLVDFSMS